MKNVNQVGEKEMLMLQMKLQRQIIRNGNVTVCIIDGKYKGVAKCCEGDIYDPMIGEVIATNRALMQLFDDETNNQVAIGNEKLRQSKLNFKVVKGDVLQSGADVVAHQVNCKGIMGGGLAAQIKRCFPDTFKAYSEYCRNKMDMDFIFGSSKSLLGECLITEEDDLIVANIFGQDDIVGQIQTDYIALETGLTKLRDYMINNGLKTLGLPYMIGCGLAGGDVNVVMHIVKTVFTNSKIKVTFYDVN